MLVVARSLVPEVSQAHGTRLSDEAGPDHGNGSNVVRQRFSVGRLKMKMLISLHTTKGA